MSHIVHLAALKLAAESCEYRLAILGEVGGAVELIAAPWTDGSCCAEKLIQALVDSIKSPAVMVSGPSDRPMGRTVYVLTVSHDLQFAVNVVPRYAIFRIAPLDPENDSPAS